MANLNNPVAIIGTGIRFPDGIDSPSKMWDFLKDPYDLSTVPTNRFSTIGLHPGNSQEQVPTIRAYLIEGNQTHRQFDSQFLGISPSEARTMDPQLRLLMETVYEALERSGQAIENLRGSEAAVFSGVMRSDYTQIMVLNGDYSTIGPCRETGTSHTLISNRISHFLDWQGASMTIDTACSSNLVALHRAVQEIRSGRSTLAVVTDTNLLLDPLPYAGGNNLRMISPDGWPRMWSESANGYARGEGVVALVLKPLRMTEEDGHHIECLSREPALNQDGKTAGITMPNPDAQVKLIRECYGCAGLDLHNVSDHPQYFEAHRTGTAVGDVVEAQAICSAFYLDKGEEGVGSNPLFVGSVKTVIGHNY